MVLVFYSRWCLKGSSTMWMVNRWVHNFSPWTRLCTTWRNTPTSNLQWRMIPSNNKLTLCLGLLHGAIRIFEKVIILSMLHYMLLLFIPLNCCTFSLENDFLWWFLAYDSVSCVFHKTNFIIFRFCVCHAIFGIAATICWKFALFFRLKRKIESLI